MEEILRLTLDPSSKKSIEDYRASVERMGKATGMAAADMEALKKVVGSLKVTSPFSKMVADINSAKVALVGINNSLQQTVTNVRKGVGDLGFSKQVVEVKALEASIQSVNAEVEKQAQLKAKVMAIRGTGALSKELAIQKQRTAELEQQLILAERIAKTKTPAAGGYSKYAQYKDINEYAASLDKMGMKTGPVAAKVAALRKELLLLANSVQKGQIVKLSRFDDLKRNIADLENL